MAVAVKNPNPAPTTPPANPRLQLAMGSWAGVAYVLGSLLVVFYAIPKFWAGTVAPVLDTIINSFTDAFFLLVAMLAAAVGLVVLGTRLIGPAPPHGLRGGIFLGTATLGIVGLVTYILGGILQSIFGPGQQISGLVLMAAAGIGLLAWAIVSSSRPAVIALAETIEDQGWFSTTFYKKSQGLKVRRGTLLGVLVIGGTGVYTLLEHGTFASQPNWVVDIPCSGGAIITLIPDAQFVVPLLIAAITGWFGFRVINFPAFTDFLIATEAELNKVSWTTGRRLIRDTLVVLTTLILFTVFLFFVDIFWIWFLTTVGVNQVSDKQPDKIGARW
jgi:preprotein translocase SecE subunit